MYFPGPSFLPCQLGMLSSGVPQWGVPQNMRGVCMAVGGFAARITDLAVVVEVPVCPWWASTAHSAVCLLL
jgi:hypothetical protein